MLGKFSGVESKRTISKFRKKKENFVLYSPTPQSGNKEVSSRGHAMSRKCAKMCEKLLIGSKSSLYIFATMVMT